MELTLARLKDISTRIASELALAPHTGRLWLDIVLLFACALLQHAILPTATRGLVPIDLMTPWLVIGFVQQPLLRSLVLLVIGALLVELHSAIPAGLYIAALWVVCATIMLFRSSLSWWHAFPWVVTFALSELWIVAFESFAHSISAGGWTLGPLDIGREALRILLSVGLGMILCQRFLHAHYVEGD